MNSNRIRYRKIAQVCRRLLTEEGQLAHQEMVESFVRIMMETAWNAAGFPCRLLSHNGPEPDGTVIPREVEEKVRRELESILPEDWQNKPEWAGWLYQYLLEERKDAVFAELKKGRKAGFADIPAITQLFTPEWIACYLAENTVGRLWLDAHPDSSLPEAWLYYDKETKAAGGNTHEMGQGSIPPDQWMVLDPTCGCGHLLAAAFDVLLAIYQEAGYDDAAAVRLILERNLAGADIDPVAVRICRFVLLLKAAVIDPALAEEPVSLRIETVAVPGKEELGSLLRVGDAPDCSDISVLDDTYDAVITNPPYLGRRHMSPELAAFLDERYPCSSNDLFAAFLERALEFLRPGGYHGTINQQAWMYLSGYEELRRKLLEENTLLSLLHLGSRAFDEITGDVVQTVSFVIRKECPPINTVGIYWNLTEEPSPGAKEAAYLGRNLSLRSMVDQHGFLILPGARISYGLPEPYKKLFRQVPALSELYAVKKGMDTGNNDTYVRYWHEVPDHQLSFKAESSENAVWFPYAKGGGFRQWYGNHYYVVRWANNGRDIRSDPRSNLRNQAYYGRPGITWSTVSTERVGFRLLESGFLFDNGGSSLFPLTDESPNRCGLLAYLNSELIDQLLRQLNPTLNVQPGDVARLPADEALLNDPELVGWGETCAAIAKQDWDETEWSWHFSRHPLAVYGESSGRLEEASLLWRKMREERAVQLFNAERAINRHIRLHYELEEVGNVTNETPVQLPSLKEDIHSLLSYAVGCLLGRYPMPDADESFEPLYLDRNLLLPRFERWLACLWGLENVEANLAWIGRSLKCKGKEPPVERIIRYFQDQFYRDHLSFYFKKPYYARLSSGACGALAALVPLRRVDHQLLFTLLLEIKRRLGSDSLLQQPDSVEAKELIAYADRINRFIADNPKELDSDSCNRTIYRHYAPLFES